MWINKVYLLLTLHALLFHFCLIGYWDMIFSFWNDSALSPSRLFPLFKKKKKLWNHLEIVWENIACNSVIQMLLFSFFLWTYPLLSRRLHSKLGNQIDLFSQGYFDFPVFILTLPCFYLVAVTVFIVIYSDGCTHVVLLIHQIL